MAFPRTSLIAASLVAAFAGAAIAQAPAPAAGASAPQAQGPGKHRFDPAVRQAMFARKLAELKQKLQITSAQEGAWTAFTSAMQPSGERPRVDRDALSRMTTPERIDQMRALRAQRSAEMDRRMEATKTFYAALSPEQRKVFDQEAGRHMQRGGPRGEHHRGHHGAQQGAPAR